jgi:transcriptional regulator
MAPKKDPDQRVDLRQGTLDLLILRILAWGPTHGHNIVKGIERASDDALLVDHGSLYPTLQRLEGRGLIIGEWGTSENNRQARFYRLTPAGKKALVRETSRWERLSTAVARVLRSSPDQA